MEVVRVGALITPESHPSAGSNINGPSLLRVPDWVREPLGRYYLYFADHKGSSIRLAVADEITGPYTMHPPGALQLADSRFPTETPQGIEPRSEIQRAAIEAEGYDAHFTPHIASPDVVVDHDRRMIWMAYHGLCHDGSQLTRMASSSKSGATLTATGTRRQCSSASSARRSAMTRSRLSSSSSPCSDRRFSVFGEEMFTVT